MSAAPKRVELTAQERDSLFAALHWTGSGRPISPMTASGASSVIRRVLPAIAELVADREAAARREALLEAATKCDCAALLIETNSHEEHCAIYRDPERERDAAVAALRRVETLAEDFRKSGFTSVYESALEIAELIDRALAEPERDGEPCSCGSRDATSLTPGEWLHHSPDGCTIERDKEGEA